jgi:hypothetical protein
LGGVPTITKVNTKKPIAHDLMHRLEHFKEGIWCSSIAAPLHYCGTSRVGKLA